MYNMQESSLSSLADEVMAEFFPRLIERTHVMIPTWIYATSVHPDKNPSLSPPRPGKEQFPGDVKTELESKPSYVTCSKVQGEDEFTRR
jgi:hypothetical protein